MTFHSIMFVHPLWLLVGLVSAAAILALGVRLDRQRRQALTRFSSRQKAGGSSLSRPLRGLKRALLCAGVLAGCTALARPQRGFRWEEAHRRGIDLLFALDTSKSMLAPDLKPNRLTRAKLAVSDLVAKFEGNRVGLVAFAGDAFLQCPLTLDRDMFQQTLDAVDTSMIPRGGTDVGRAIEVARAALHNEPANQKILVFLTDGEDLEAHAVEAARDAAKDGVRIFTVGVGTPGGELIPLGGPGQLVRDESGNFVRSRLDETTLQAMAASAGGDYRQLGADGHGLEALYQDVLAKLPREALGARMKQVPLDRFQWPLGLAIVCLALEPLIRERRWRARAIIAAPPVPRKGFAVFKRRAATTLAIGIALMTAGLAHASPGDGEKAYRDGKFQKAAEEYSRALARSPDDPKLQYNLGAAAYKSGDFDKAGAALERALHTDRLDLQRDAYYDAGNTLFRIGQKTVEKQPEQTIEKWKKSIASYESALKLAAKDADAIYNRDLVKRKLAELERQQEQKKKDQQNQKQSDQQKQPNQKDQQAQNQPGQKGQPGQQGQQPKTDQQLKQGQQAKPDQQAKQGQQPQKDQPAQQGQQPKPDPSTEPGAPEKDKEVPGQLSRNDAKALLDALRGDERLMPIARTGRKRPLNPDDAVRKDW